MSHIMDFNYKLISEESVCDKCSATNRVSEWARSHPEKIKLTIHFIPRLGK